ncbi:MAG TPA: tetratricopeptide repeat protein, partial [Chitinophagales bacterium]|nr:tetratricopeptide repeat protein [Chitinophagales bacterium]
EYEKLGDWGGAAQLLEKLLVIDSGYLGAYYHLGKIYEQLAEVKKALNIYEAGIRQAQAQQDLHTVGELRNARMNLELEL